LKVPRLAPITMLVVLNCTTASSTFFSNEISKRSHNPHELGCGFSLRTRCRVSSRARFSPLFGWFLSTNTFFLPLLLTFSFAFAILRCTHSVTRSTVAPYETTFSTSTYTSSAEPPTTAASTNEPTTSTITTTIRALELNCTEFIGPPLYGNCPNAKDCFNQAKVLTTFKYSNGCNECLCEEAGAFIARPLLCI
jgi:hypothetical protein